MTLATIAVDRASGPPDEPAPPAVSVSWRLLPWLVIAVSACLFAYGVTTIPQAPPSQFGLIVSVSPAYGLSILLAAVGFAIAARRRTVAAAVVAVILMIVVQRLPSAVATDAPMYSWTYKHLGVVDYIQHTQSLARGVDVYNNWPGLFAITAWFSDLTGIAPMGIAHWYTPVFHCAIAILAYAGARAWGLTSWASITAVFLLITLNWVSQDYFAPQSTTFLLTVALFIVVGLCRDRPVGVLLIVLLFTAATISHQLTPFWIYLAIGLLIVGRKMKPWWILIPLAVILFGFLAINWDSVSQYQMFSFDLKKNTEGNVPTVGVLGQRITSYGVRTLAGSMWLGTALVLLVRWRRKQPFWALGVLALSPLMIIGGADYGGEAIFRVFLFSLLGCSFVLAPMLVGALQGTRGRFAAALAVVVVATALAAQGFTGTWYAYVMPRDQVYTSQVVLNQAELPAYLTPAAPVWPQRSNWRYVDYAKFNDNYDDPMIFAAKLVGSHFDTDEDYDKFMEAARGRADATTYLILTEQTRMYAWYFGILPLDALPNLKARLRNDPRWEPLFDGNGIAVYIYRVEVGNRP